MKTITIPKRFGYPTVDIEVNGIVHTFTTGVEIEMEDHLAEVIENAVALAPKQGRNANRLAQRTEGGIEKITATDLDGITTIAGYAFYNLKSLKEATINKGIKTIKECAFFGCSSLEIVRFEDDSELDAIETNVFDWCAKLVKVYLPETPPSLANVDSFQNINSACVFYCKTQASLNAYKAATNWSTLAGTYTFKVEQ